MTYIVETKNLKKNYLQGKMDVPALKGINLQIKEGNFISILGPSGSGKSTLLNMIGVLDRPTEGHILIDGQDTEKMNKNELIIYRRKIGFVFQFFNLINRLTALENVELPLSIQGMTKEKRVKIATEMLNLVGLSDRINHSPNELSGGQQQRVAIARALAREPMPRYLLMDEPTGNVDSKTRNEILELIIKLNREQKITVIIITHDLYIAKLANQTLYLIDGQIYNSVDEYEKKNKIAGEIFNEIKRPN